MEYNLLIVGLFFNSILGTRPNKQLLTVIRKHQLVTNYSKQY